MSDDDYRARMRKLCETYGHEWHQYGETDVKCGDCGQIGDVVNVRDE